MPMMTEHAASDIIKMLYIGNSGAGKTGSLASLARAGYNIRMLDLDMGSDILYKYRTEPKSPYFGAPGEVHIEAISDKMKANAITGRMVPGKATVWQRMAKMLENWKPESATPGEDGKPLFKYDLGPVISWGPRDILVLDSLTTICNAAMAFVLQLNGRVGQPAQQSDWYQGQQLVESLMQTLYDSHVGCNVIICCHIQFIDTGNGPEMGYPSSLGKALSPKLGRYFNSVVMAATSGSGANTKRQLVTQSTGLVELKNTSPMTVEKTYPLESGLADFFAAVKGPLAK